MALFSAQQAAAIPRPAARQEGKPMALNEYDVEINGRQTTLQLSDEDAEAMGLTKATVAKSAPTKARTAANKARTAANKSGNAG